MTNAKQPAGVGQSYILDAIMFTRSAVRTEYPHSLSYQDMTFTIVPWKAIVDVRERWITRAMASAYRGWIFGELAKIGKSPTMTPKRISHCVRLAYELRGALYDRIIQPHLTGWQQHKVMDFKEDRLDGSTAILEVEAIMEEISDHTLQALPEPPTELAAAILEEARRKHGG